MKLRVMFKTPDAVDSAICQEEQSDPECRSAFEFVTRKYVNWGETIRVEFDTETQTAKVLKLGE